MGTMALFDADLQAVRDGDMYLEQVCRKYDKFMYRLVGKLAYNGPASADACDYVQEGWLGVMDALESFDPERGITLAAFACSRACSRCKTMKDGLRRRQVLEHKYLQHQIIEDKVLEVLVRHEDGVERGVVALTQADQEQVFLPQEAKERYLFWLWKLAPAQQSVVAGICAGRTREEIVAEVYGRTCVRPDKQYRRAIAAFVSLMELSLAQQESESDGTPHPNRRYRLRPLKVCRPNPREELKAAVAS